ncbi:MAG: hypothetical protein ABI840_01725 [bacterium]
MKATTTSLLISLTSDIITAGLLLTEDKSVNGNGVKTIVPFLICILLSNPYLYKCLHPCY